MLHAHENQICTRCIMDTSDPDIEFDANGVCNHCRKAEWLISHVLNDPNREVKLARLIETIKISGRNKQYDCIIGLSGGIDSTYVAYKVKEFGLRPLSVHLDNGWDTDVAIDNIQRTVDQLGIDLYTYVIDWSEYRDMQVAFLKASVPHVEHPNDHAITAILHRVAAKHGVRYIVVGSNISTESYGVKSWSGGQRDWKYIKSIHERFGKVRLKTYPYMSGFDIFKYKYRCRHETISILDYIPYIKEEAMNVLERKIGWTYYGGKHYESLFTKFFQAYILPQKFGIDKRRIHLSALIASGQINREQALKKMEEELYPEDQLREDMNKVINKLGLSKQEFDEIMNLPPRSFWDYPSYENSWWFKYLYPMVRRKSNLQ